MNNLTLEETSIERDLGVMVDNKLTWLNQINHAKANAYAALSNIKRSFVFWTPYTFKVLFSTFARPHLEYCASIWSPCNLSEIKALESVQKHATKAVPSLRSLCYEDTLKALGLTTLEHRRIRGDLIQFFKFYKGLNKINWRKPLLNCASLAQPGPASSIRGGSHRLAKYPPSRCSARENFLCNRVINRNQLPNSIIEATSTSAFKISLDTFIKNNPAFI
jgi:ribonucleases P/MRP protein subunit RPP40